MQYVVTDVLDFYGVNYNNADNNILTVICPFHDDNNPSGKINLTTGQYTCWPCNRHTTVLVYIAKKHNKDILTVYREVAALDSTPSKHYIEDPSNIETWHTRLWDFPELLKALHDRCVSDTAIAKYRLGAFKPGDDVAEIRIPLRDKRGNCIGVKSYRPGAKEKKYFWPRVNSYIKNKELVPHLLFPPEQLAYHTMVICGGELKAIAAADVLNQYDIGCISGTGSESVLFTPGQLAAFTGKIVYVLYDVDQTGIIKAEQLCRTLRAYTSDIYLVKLPLDPDIHPHGDVNDFLATGGNLYDLIKSTPQWVNVPPSFDKLSGIDANEEPINISLDKAVAASMAKRKVKVQVVISSMDNSPYSIPKDIQISCDRNHSYCSVCMVHQAFTNNTEEVKLSCERVEIMEMIGKELNKQEAILKKAFGVPQRCTYVTFVPQTFYHVEDVRVSQHLDITSRTNERSMQAAYCIGETRLELNEEYSITGRMYPHPATQQATLLITGVEPMQDALSTYVPANLEALKVFQPKEWTEESISAKLDEIYADLSHNVTRIYGRQDLHLLYDLAYHSVLLLPNNLKGWVEVLVVGDSAQGKTLCADRLIEHYGLGERVVCKGATVAGLLGGVQPYGKRWFVTWGKIPTHDRRILFLDEVKGTNTEVIAGLTDMRSKGIAEITKIEKRRANARTRLVMISNPRSERVIREYNTGIDAIKELIGSPEDIRRFDAIMVVAQKEVPDNIIHARERPTYEHVYTSSLCRDLILFGWTVPAVEIEDEYYINDVAQRLISTYVEDIPIVDTNTMREKLLRLSAALAVRTFSVKDQSTVLVRNCHLDYLYTFLSRIYSNPAFGYLEYSKKKLAMEAVIEPEAVKYRLLNKVPFPGAFIHELLTLDEFDTYTFQDILGWDVANARDLLAFLNRHHCLKRNKKMYRKSTSFSRLLISLEELLKENGEDRPSFIPEEF